MSAKTVRSFARPFTRLAPIVLTIYVIALAALTVTMNASSSHHAAPDIGYSVSAPAQTDVAATRPVPPSE